MQFKNTIMSDIQLKFVNQSNDRNKSEVVIFQKNVASSFDELAVAWKVIQNCGQGWSHYFVYPMEMFVSASDSWGNSSQQQPATNGQLFTVVNPSSNSSG